MSETKLQEPQDATLLDVLIDAFEKNEVLGGFHYRQLPLADEAAAVRKFAALADEAKRWKGAALRTQETSSRRIAVWDDLEIRQAGRGILVRIRTPRFHHWWHEGASWEGDPMAQIFDWIRQEDGHGENLG